jgi:hypothetical protein
MYQNPELDQSGKEGSEGISAGAEQDIAEYLPHAELSSGRFVPSGIATNCYM